MSTIAASPPTSSLDSRVEPGSFDRDLQTALLKILKRSGYTELSSVHVEVHEGYVRLSGKLPSFYLKQVAQSLLQRVDGVDLLRSDIVVG